VEPTVDFATLAAWPDAANFTALCTRTAVCPPLLMVAK